MGLGLGSLWQQTSDDDRPAHSPALALALVPAAAKLNLESAAGAEYCRPTGDWRCGLGDWFGAAALCQRGTQRAEYGIYGTLLRLGRPDYRL